MARVLASAVRRRDVSFVCGKEERCIVATCANKPRIGPSSVKAVTASRYPADASNATAKAWPDTSTGGPRRNRQSPTNGAPDVGRTRGWRDGIGEHTRQTDSNPGAFLVGEDGIDKVKMVWWTVDTSTARVLASGGTRGEAWTSRNGN